jgi:ABC-type transport system substrate-binding protein
LHASDQTKRKKLAEDIQRVTLGEVAYVPWGEWIWPTAFRKNVHGILKFTAPLFWNVTIT